jgi:hypothetical protein
MMGKMKNEIGIREIASKMSTWKSAMTWKDNYRILRKDL